MSISNLLVKSIGITGAALSAYNVVVDGNSNAKQETKEDLGSHYTDIYVKNLSLSRECSLLNKIMNNVTRGKLDTQFYPFVIGAKNYVTNYIDQVFENIVPITLSGVAIFAPMLMKKNVSSNSVVIKKLPSFLKSQKSGETISAISAGLLLLGAAKLFLNDVWGAGKETI